MFKEQGCDHEHRALEERALSPLHHSTAKLGAKVREVSVHSRNDRGGLFDMKIVCCLGHWL